MKETNDDNKSHEIKDLYKLMTDMNEIIKELQEKNNKQEKEIAVLRKIVVHYDECHKNLANELIRISKIAIEAKDCVTGKKHKRCEEKDIKQLITCAREHWKQQNGGYTFYGMEFL